MSTATTRGGSTGITMLARASSSAAVIRTVPGARPAIVPWGVTAATPVSAECQVTGRYTGHPRLSFGVASSRISSPMWSGSLMGSITMSSACGGATSTRRIAVTSLQVAVTIADPGASAVARTPAPSMRRTSGASVLHRTARGGSRVPCSPRITATSEKLSPASRSVGAGMMEMPPTGRTDAPPAADARVRGAGLVGVGTPESEDPPSAETHWVSPARSGSSSASGAAPSAAMASAMRGHRAAGSLSSMRRIAASTSGGQSPQSSRMGRGECSTCACITVSVEPANGGSPVTSS